MTGKLFRGKNKSKSIEKGILKMIEEKRSKILRLEGEITQLELLLEKEGQI